MGTRPELLGYQPDSIHAFIDRAWPRLGGTLLRRGDDVLGRTGLDIGRLEAAEELKGLNIDVADPEQMLPVAVGGIAMANYCASSYRTSDQLSLPFPNPPVFEAMSWVTKNNGSPLEAVGGFVVARCAEGYFETELPEADVTEAMLQGVNQKAFFVADAWRLAELRMPIRV